MRRALAFLAQIVVDLAGDPPRRPDPIATLKPRIVERDGLAYVVFTTA